MYFGLAEEMPSSADAMQYWNELGLELQFIKHAGTARHVFTHRIWIMNIYHYILRQKPSETFFHEHEAQLCQFAAIKSAALFPTAMKAAKEAALEIL